MGIRVGMRADDVLKVKGYGSKDAIGRPTRIEKDEAGWVIAWHYPGCDVILHRRLGHYRVREILEVAG